MLLVRCLQSVEYHVFPTCSRSLLFCCALSIGFSASEASERANAPVTFQRSSSAYVETEGNLKQRQIAFLNRIRKADPKHQTIERALFNDQNELGLILNRSVEMDKIPALMRSMLDPDGTRVSRSGFNHSRLYPFQPAA